jgi:hypothetical protein
VTWTRWWQIFEFLVLGFQHAAVVADIPRFFTDVAKLKLALAVPAFDVQTAAVLHKRLLTVGAHSVLAKYHTPTI